MASQKQWKVIIVLLVLQILFLRGSSEYVSDIYDYYAYDDSELTDETTTLTTQLPHPDVLSLHIYSNIKYRYATTVVTSTVVNPADITQAINFTVALPESAFITGFTVMTEDKTYKSLIKEKVCKNRDTGVTESGLPYFKIGAHRYSKQFTVSINTEPFKRVDFNLTYEQMLIRSLGVYHHVVNINPGQIIPDLSVTVKITETAEIVKLQVQQMNAVSSNKTDYKIANELATIERPGPAVATLHWVPTPEQQKQIGKDGVSGKLIVKYDVDRESNPQHILVEEGYFVHFFAPESIPVLCRHIVFVLDYSGSVFEYKREQIRTAMKTALSNLSPSDYFSLVLFSEKAATWYPFISKFTDQLYEVQLLSNDLRSSVEQEEHDDEDGGKDEDYDYETEDDLSNGVLPASRDNKELALEFLESFAHYGTTNIMDGLRKGINVTLIGKSLFQNETLKPEPLIVFLTDGEPNVEIFDTEEIIKEVTKLNTDRIPIFCVGFGLSADSNFLHKLSLNNNAFARNIPIDPESYPYPVEQLVVFFKEISSSWLTNVHFNYNPEQINFYALTSRVDFPIHFNGSEIVVAGRLHKADPVSAGELLAKSSTGIIKYPIVIHIAKDSDFKKIWAYLTLKQLMDNITFQEGTEHNDTKMKAVDLALQYSFETPLTMLTVVKLDSASPTNGTHSSQ